MVDLWARMSRTDRHGYWCVPGRDAAKAVAGERFNEVASVEAAAAGELWAAGLAEMLVIFEWIVFYVLCVSMRCFVDSTYR